MASGVTVEPQALRDTGEKLQALGDQAGSAVGKAAGAVVHPKSWGLVGMATLYSAYAGSLPRLQEHLHAVQTTLGAAGAKLDDAAQAYEKADKATGVGLDRMGEKLPDGTPMGSGGSPVECGPRPEREPRAGQLTSQGPWAGQRQDGE